MYANMHGIKSIQGIKSKHKNLKSVESEAKLS